MTIQKQPSLLKQLLRNIGNFFNTPPAIAHRQPSEPKKQLNVKMRKDRETRGSNRQVYSRPESPSDSQGDFFNLMLLNSMMNSDHADVPSSDTHIGSDYSSCDCSSSFDSGSCDSGGFDSGGFDGGSCDCGGGGCD